MLPGIMNIREQGEKLGPRPSLASCQVAMRKLWFVALLVVGTGTAQAQIIRSRFPYNREPNAWFSMGAGIQDGWKVLDKNFQWTFGNSTEFNVALERPVGSQASIGIEGTTAMVPVSTVQFDIVYPDYNARVSRGFLTLHLSPGSGQFHTVLNVKAGATFYSFENGLSDTDFSYVLGYGFGYNFTPRFSIDIVQDQVNSLHQRDGLTASSDASSRTSVTRLVGRVGLGG